MTNTDILNMGSMTMIAGHSEIYKGLLFTAKVPRSSFFDGHFFLIDVKEIKDDKILAYYSISRTTEEEFASQRMKGKYYMIVKHSGFIRDILPSDDLSCS
ncbi:hypothetical protein [Terrimonas ferruginea]|uniref:hypothetical protein n=1 Tax=Terrimonas ferruginea TaxID=249 RepID=UPI00048EED3F|nr:hypothetical protein [Terrimonas ferruginea]